MAAKKTASKSASKPKSSATTGAAKLVGQPFLSSDVDVARDRADGKKGQEPRRIAGGRLVSDLEGDEKLSKEEISSLTASGVIRPATMDDANRALAAEESASANERDRELSGRRREVAAKYDAERAGIRAKHDAARDAELADVDSAEADEVAKLEADAADEANEASK